MAINHYSKVTATGAVSSNACVISGMLIGTDGSNDPVVTVYDNTTNTNEVIPTGNILRLRVSMVTAGATATRYGIDPAGRTDSDLTLTTTSKIHIPYRLDL